jgi:hypothetical protein
MLAFPGRQLAPFTAKAEMAAVVVNAKPAAVLRESPCPV